MNALRTNAPMISFSFGKFYPAIPFVAHTLKDIDRQPDIRHCPGSRELLKLIVNMDEGEGFDRSDEQIADYLGISRDAARGRLARTKKAGLWAWTYNAMGKRVRRLTLKPGKKSVAVVRIIDGVSGQPISCVVKAGEDSDKVLEQMKAIFPNHITCSKSARNVPHSIRGVLDQENPISLPGREGTLIHSLFPKQDSPGRHHQDTQPKQPTHPVVPTATPEPTNPVTQAAHPAHSPSPQAAHSPSPEAAHSPRPRRGKDWVALMADSPIVAPLLERFELKTLQPQLARKLHRRLNNGTFDDSVFMLVLDKLRTLECGSESTVKPPVSADDFLHRFREFRDYFVGRVDELQSALDFEASEMRGILPLSKQLRNCSYYYKGCESQSFASALAKMKEMRKSESTSRNLIWVPAFLRCRVEDVRADDGGIAVATALVRNPHVCEFIEKHLYIKTEDLCGLTVSEIWATRAIILQKLESYVKGLDQPTPACVAEIYAKGGRDMVEFLVAEAIEFGVEGVDSGVEALEAAA